MNTKRAKRGYSLPQVLLTIVLIGIMAAVTVPAFYDGAQRGKDNNALVVASGIDAAITSYQADVRGASSAWASADNAGRYALLKAANVLPKTAPASLSALQASGYTYTLPSTLDGITVVSGKDGVLQRK